MIHPTAIIAKGAQIGNNVTIGPYCVIGAQVVLHDNTNIYSHTVIDGNTTIGENTTVFPFASIGSSPQNQNKYDPGAKLIIGKNNIIREYVSIQPGIAPPKGKLITTIGNHNLLMLGTEIGHDCHIGNHCVLASKVGLAGHVTLHDHVIVGGMTGVHQHVRIGSYAMIGGLSGVGKDVFPYALVHGAREATCHGPNIIGLKRHGFSNEQIRNIMAVYELLKNSKKSMEEKLTHLHTHYDKDADIKLIFDFIDTLGQRGLTGW